MATVKIGDRELRVLHKSEPGSFLVDHKLVLAWADVAEAAPAQHHPKMASVILCYVGGHNEPPVTLEWLLEKLPGDLKELMRALREAAGHPQADAEAAAGEGSRP